MTTLYKIRNITDGTFSTGGSKPTFNSKGKTWTSLGHLKNHISSVARNKRLKTDPYGVGTEVVEYTLTEGESAKMGRTLSTSFDNLERVFNIDSWRERRAKERAHRKAEEEENAQILAEQEQLFAKFDEEFGSEDSESEESSSSETETVSSSSTSSSSTPW